MPRKIVSLLQEPNLEEERSELPYANLLKELSCEALQRRPLYDYRGKTAKQVRARIEAVKRIVRRCLHLPARAIPGKPMRVRERLAVQFDGFSIRPVAIERGRGWWITAHLYVPDGMERPAPAVMHVHGHSYEGKSTLMYARRCRGLARRGFVVLFVDFPEADERKGTGHALWYPTMANLPLPRIMVEDNSAALTYLAALPFVDERRIGVTGSSGGGNQTVFLSVADERVAAAAPTNAPCLIAEHAVSGSGAYCHCEAIPGLVAAGVEYHDLLAAIAPRPLGVFAGIRDPLFPIIGARRAVEEASFAYRGLTAAHRCYLQEHYCVHAVPDDMRLGTYLFFESALKHPGDLDGPGDEGEDVDLSDPRLRALPKRRARPLSVADLYRRELGGKRLKGPSPARLNRLLGRRSSDANGRGLAGAVGREWARIVVEMGDGGVVPLAIRGSGTGGVTVAVADGGKDEALKRVGGRRGRIAVFDWRGQGETAPPNEEWQQRAAHYLAFSGSTLVGGRVTDLVGVVKWLRRKGYAVEEVLAFGGEASMVAVLAGSVETGFPKVELHEMLRTLRDAPGMSGQVRYTAWVPGLALVTDIPQLLRGLGTRVRVRSWLKPGAEKPREGYT
ncbi:MAG TPA: acetylxylan esterase [Armatimonadota bacterium]|nr:acetylxylan esterase [Armatimonadota bacterium]